MRLRLGMNRSPPLAKRSREDDDFVYSYNNMYQPTRGKRNVPLPPKPRLSPFVEYDDCHEFKQFGDRRTLKDSVTGEYLDDCDPVDSWSRHPPRPPSSNGRRSNDGQLVRAGRARTSSSQRDCYGRRRGVWRETGQGSYRGGYDFRDDVDSIDSHAREYRQQIRRAKAHHSRQSLSSSSEVPSLRKINRHNHQNLSLYEKPSLQRRGSSRHSEQRSSSRECGSTVGSTIATYEDHWDLMRSMSSISGSSINPQLLNARHVPDFPPGYLQRSDGVVLSLGSTIASGEQKERYSDAEAPPEDAAEDVIKNLRDMGYTIDERDGILGSNSDAAGSSHRYGGSPSDSLSTQVKSEKSKGSAANSKASKQEPIFQARDYGVESPPSVSFPPTFTNAAARSLASRAEEFSSTTQHEVGSHPKVSITPRATDAAASVSSGSKVSREKNTDPSNNQANSTGSKRPENKESTSIGSKGSTRSQKRVEDPPATLVQSFFAESVTEDFTDTKASTELADGSTLTTKPTSEPQPAVVVDIQNAKLSSVATDETNSGTEKWEQSTNKRVGFSGEYPEMTKSGERVPELVMNYEGLNPDVSDLSYHRSMETSAVSSVGYFNQQGSFSTLCDKLLFSCRITAFPSPRHQ